MQFGIYATSFKMKIEHNLYAILLLIENRSFHFLIWINSPEFISLFL